MSQLVAFVTSCSSSIGRALADTLQRAGYRVRVSTRKEDDAHALAEAGFQTVQLDVSDAAVPARLAGEPEVEAAGLDVLVNSAGCGTMGSLLDGGVDTIRRQLETNVFAVVGMTRALFLLLRRRSDLAMNVGSVSSVLVTPFASTYCASKAVIHALSNALRLELAPFDVKVLEVQPGVIALNFDAGASRETDSVVGERSPWWPLRRQIQARVAASQDNSTPTEDFTRQSFAAVQCRPYPLLIRIDNGSRALSAPARWLPRGLLERLLKKRFGLDTRL